MFRKLGIVALMSVATAIPSIVSAQGFLGQTIHGVYLYPTSSAVYQDMGNAVVGGGTEFSLFNIAIDLSANQINLSRAGAITFLTGSFNGWHFSDVLSTMGAITGVTVVGGSIAGFDASRVSFDADNIYLNFVNLTDTQNFQAAVDVTFASTVPEPGALLLVGSGLDGVFGFARRRRKG